MNIPIGKHPCKILNVFGMLALGSALSAPVLGASSAKQPKLIVQITVDALRADLITRYSGTFGKGGFDYLLSKGTVYSNAHYHHANTETIVGHVSLATGTTPSHHGMVGNVWYDEGEKRLVYNIEDENYALLTSGADVDSKNEIDPTQKTAKVEGRSPNAIKVSTFSDELGVSQGHDAKIFAVSVKDRGAVSLAGKLGKAFWFSKAKGEFVTSSYYYDQYPDWVVDWNIAKPLSQYDNKAWELLNPLEAYKFGSLDDQEYETDFPGFGRVFPHPFGSADDKYFTTKLTLSPAGDELTASFAKTLIENEGLGLDNQTDYLAVSFSSTDYVGHLFGASSLEQEDNLAHLDKTLADLFAYINRNVGLRNTLIVLSADHGQPEVPEHLHQLGMKTGHRFDPKLLSKDALESMSYKANPKKVSVIDAFFPPYVYLNHANILKHNLDATKVEQAIAEELEKIDGIGRAVSGLKGLVVSSPEDTVTRSVVNNYFSGRSGDIHIVFEPDVYISDFDGLSVASTHGSVWDYDRFVPVIFAGNHIKSKRVSRAVTPYDIAPTLSAMLGIKSPSSAVGASLVEVTK